MIILMTNSEIIFEFQFVQMIKRCNFLHPKLILMRFQFNLR